ncbi:hypothetical protein AHF37_07387 [Paragonimus kellicotti]|nr:hypothetical protein AHF37_07387 [Paragonimus kellicotti]
MQNPDLAIVTALDGELWLEARRLQSSEPVICTQNEGRKRYPFKEPFITYAPVMKKTQVICPLLDPN